MESKFKDIHLIAFDADDTLWDCQGHFDAVEKDYCKILSPYGSEEAISKSLFEVETKNMPDLGYGSKAFTISLVENAIKVSNSTVSNFDIQRIITLGKSLLRLPATPLPGVVETLKTLREKIDKGERNYKMVVFTKGDNLDQEGKFRRSGLDPYFDDIEVVANKTKLEYRKLCSLFDTSIENLCMVGNSYKSDVKPVIDLGGYAVHIPYPLMWKLEVTEVIPHPNLIQINDFKKLTDIF